MLEKVLIVTADWNDGDYVTKITRYKDWVIPKQDQIIIEAIAKVNTSYDEDIEGKIWELIPKEAKDEIMDKWIKEEWEERVKEYWEDWINDLIWDFLPYVDNWEIHTIKSVEVLEINNRTKYL